MNKIKQNQTGFSIISSIIYIILLIILILTILSIPENFSNRQNEHYKQIAFCQQNNCEAKITKDYLFFTMETTSLTNCYCKENGKYIDYEVKKIDNKFILVKKIIHPVRII